MIKKLEKLDPELEESLLAEEEPRDDTRDEPAEASDDRLGAERLKEEPRDAAEGERPTLGEELGEESEEEVPQVPDFPKHPTEEDKERLLKIIEAILFASTEGLTGVRLAEVLKVPIGLVKEMLEVLGERLGEDERPYELREFGGAWRLYTRAEFYPFLLRLRGLKKVERLTPAALETLAIIAYRQPVIRAEIEAIRGVRAGPLLRALLDRKLIRVVGRADVPGGPMQYGTTQRFLDRFALKSLKDLPSLKEFKQGRI